jgi:hypothetical protein
MVGRLLALGTLCYAITLPVSPALALEYGNPPPGLECINERMSAELIGRYTTLLAPPEGANVPAGTTVTFSAESGRASTPLTFRLASSPTLLSNPDIASGAGTRELTATYAFTSTAAGAVPRTVYWAASFTLNLKGCESPFTYTTPARVLTVTALQPQPSSPSSGVAGNTSSAPSQSKALTRAQKLAHALHACKKTKSKKKRKACEAKARKLYSAKKKAKKA